MGTLSKAAGLSGGYLCARRSVIDLLINRARSFVYSTAPPPSLAFAAKVSIELIGGDSGDQLRERLWKNVNQLAEGIDIRAESAIVPVILGSNDAALNASEKLRQAGFLIPAIRYPTVPRGQARLRITLSAAHESEQVAQLVDAMGEHQFKKES